MLLSFWNKYGKILSFLERLKVEIGALNENGSFNLLQCTLALNVTGL